LCRLPLDDVFVLNDIGGTLALRQALDCAIEIMRLSQNDKQIKE
jgi:hypothetical protein